MGWKDWPYWLRGGIISGIIFDLVVLILLWSISNSGEGGGIPLFSTAVLFGLIVGFGLGFIIGAIIGWIVGKIKSKK